MDVLTKASEAKSTTEHSLCFVLWRRVAQTSAASLFLLSTWVTVPKFPLSKEVVLKRSTPSQKPCANDNVWLFNTRLQRNVKVDQTLVGKRFSDSSVRKTTSENVVFSGGYKHSPSLHILIISLV